MSAPARRTRLELEAPTLAPERVGECAPEPANVEPGSACRSLASASIAESASSLPIGAPSGRSQAMSPPHPETASNAGRLLSFWESCYPELRALREGDSDGWCRECSSVAEGLARREALDRPASPRRAALELAAAALAVAAAASSPTAEAVARTVLREAAWRACAALDLGALAKTHGLEGAR